MSPSVPEKVSEVLTSGWVGEGPKVVEFEKKLAEFFGVDADKVVVVNSCTSALKLALRLSGVYYGDEVISTPATNLATNSVILDAGAKVVWGDIHSTTGRLDSWDVDVNIGKRTKAVVGMDWGGHPIDLERLLSTVNAVDSKIKLIEDSAHSIGSRYKGRHMSYYADFVCHSTQAVKQLNSVDGGILVCKNKEDADRARLLRWFGLDRKNTDPKDSRCFQTDVTEYGYKMNSTDVNATIGLENLKSLPEILKKHRDNAYFYDEVFSDYFVDRDSFVAESPEGRSSYWLYTLLVNNRDELMDQLRNKGIMCSKVHCRNDRHTAFVDSKTKLPGVDIFYSRCLSIPVGWWVTQAQREYIANTVVSELKNLRRKNAKNTA